MGELPGAEAVRTVDGLGRFLTPGFIDIHRHADAALLRPGFGKAELAQGLTTIVSGNCGLSLAPVSGPHRGSVLDYLSPIAGRAEEDFPRLSDYRRRANEAPLPLNAWMLAGMGTLRACAAGVGDGALADREYRRIHAALEDEATGKALRQKLETALEDCHAVFGPEQVQGPERQEELPKAS